MSPPPRVPIVALFVALLCSLIGPARDSSAAGWASKPVDFGTAGRLGSISKTPSEGLPEPNAAQVNDGTIATIPVCNIPNVQTNPVLTREGGGVIAVWEDWRNVGKDIYAQRFTQGGGTAWVFGGLPICKASGDQVNVQAISDDAGGAIVVWEDRRSDAGNIYAQRIDVSGLLKWTANGVPICTATGAQKDPVIVADGVGGAIVAWVDERSYNQVYVQRIDASGVVRWAANGVPLNFTLWPRLGLAIVSDGLEGAIVTWQDLRADQGDIWASRVTGDGATPWSNDGVPVCSASGMQETPTLVSDGVHGGIVAWADGRGGNRDIYAQRMDAAGAALWTVDGEVLSAATGVQDEPVAASDGAHGAIVAWADGRGGNRDIYAQRVSDAGSALWTVDGVEICTAAGDQVTPVIAADPLGGAVLAWADNRTPATSTDVYAQHVEVGAGAVQWTANGVQLTDAGSEQDAPQLVADGIGGATVVWRDARIGQPWDIYGQRIDVNGLIPGQCPQPGALPESYFPQIISGEQNYRTFDQPYFYWAAVAVTGDTGDWDLEVYDQYGIKLAPYPTCFGRPLAGSYRTSGVDFVMGDFNDYATPPGVYGVRAYRASGTGSGKLDWDTLEEDLNVNVAPISSPANWTGPIDCYDADVTNTTPLTGGVQYWFELVKDNPAADLKILIFSSYGHIGTDDYYYVVPRSSRVIENNARWTPFTPPVAGFYGVVVVNDNGVPTHYTIRSTTTAPTGVSDGPLATGLRSVSPNPSAGSVQFGFALREPGTVSFEVVDMAGRVVSRVAERHWEAGAWSTGWDGRRAQGDEAPPGIYFVQMRVNGQRCGISRLALVR